MLQTFFELSIHERIVKKYKHFSTLDILRNVPNQHIRKAGDGPVCLCGGIMWYCLLLGDWMTVWDPLSFLWETDCSREEPQIHFAYMEMYLSKRTKECVNFSIEKRENKMFKSELMYLLAHLCWETFWQRRHSCRRSSSSSFFAFLLQTCEALTPAEHTSI